MSEHSESVKNKGVVNKSVNLVRGNPWIAATVFLVAVLIFMIFFRSGSGDIGADGAKAKVVNFFETQGLVVTVSSVERVSGMYKLAVSAEGAGEGFVYTSLDGSYLGSMQEMNPSESSSGSTVAKEVPKSDKPVVDLYVFSYCPYGTQEEKGLLPVYNLLKHDADINIKFIGAMHGEYEQVESYRQLCIQKIYGKDKLFNYLDRFLASTEIGACQGTASCVNPLLDKLMISAGISKASVNTCMQKDAEALYAADGAAASQLGITGSPTLVVNGVIVSSGRDAASILSAVCSAFNEAPAECASELSSATPSPGFGSETSSTSVSGTC